MTCKYKVRGLPFHKPILDREDRDELAGNLVTWFAKCCDYYDPDYWFFTTTDGKYDEGSGRLPMPCPFLYQTGQWSLTLRCLALCARRPHNTIDLSQDLATLHKVVTIVLWNLLGSAPTGRLLADLRKKHDLPKLKTKDLI